MSAAVLSLGSGCHTGEVEYIVQCHGESMLSAGKVKGVKARLEKMSDGVRPGITARRDSL